MEKALEEELDVEKADNPSSSSNRDAQLEGKNINSKVKAAEEPNEEPK